MNSWSAESDAVPYARPEDRTRARPTYHVNEQNTPQGLLPQVVFVPKRRIESRGEEDRSATDDRDDVGVIFSRA
jgi:hypothetical protein